ncbi:MAG: XRE family transcriptional regulator [Clostridia bacterium]|nr:XRE family transcriptional regulator [Clostridia bacterium]
MNIQKSTDELLKILNAEEEIENYIEENKDDIIDLSLSDYLEDMLKKYNISKNTAINNSAINQIYGYQIFDGKKKSPSRDKLIQLIFGLGLNVADAQRLLKIAGVNELYPRIKRDSVIIFALNKKINITQCDELLFELGEETIIKE